MVRRIVQALELATYATTFRTIARVGYPTGIEYMKTLAVESTLGQKRKVEQRTPEPPQNS